MTEERRARINRLKWHCRRALLELDLIFQRFWIEFEESIDDNTMNVLEGLLELEDHDLWELVSGRQSSEDPQQQRLLTILQTRQNSLINRTPLENNSASERQ